MDSDTCKKSEEYVQFVCDQAKPKALSLADIIIIIIGLFVALVCEMTGRPHTTLTM